MSDPISMVGSGKSWSVPNLLAPMQSWRFLVGIMLALTWMSTAQAAWFDSAWKYRVPINVPAGASVNSTVKVDVDFTALLAALSVVGTFDANSPRIVRPDDSLATTQEFTDAVYAGATDAANNGRGEVRFLLQDAGPATYYLYFDLVANGPKAANPQTPINGNLERGGAGTATPPGWTASTRSNAAMDIQIRPSETLNVTDTGGSGLTSSTDGTPNTGQFSYLIGYRTNADSTSSNATLTKDFTVPASSPGNINIRIKPQGWDSAVNGNVTQYDFIRVRLVNPTTSAVLLNIAGPQLNNYATCPFSPNYRIAAITNTQPGYGLYNYWDNGRNSNNHTLGMSAAYNRGLQPWTNCSVSLAAVAGQSVRLEIRTDIFNQYRTWFLIDDVEWSVVAATLGVPEAAFNHLRIEHSGSGVTCLREPVTIKACADATCSTLFAGSATLTQTPTGWYAAATGGTETNTLTIPAGTAVTRYLQRATTGTLTLGATSIVPAPTATPAVRCFVGATESCNLTFADAGFIFSATAGGAEAIIPGQVAGVSSGTYQLRAVRTSTTTRACESALSGPNTVDFAYECNNPAACAASNLMTINGGASTAIARNNNGSVSSYTPVSLTFDANGNAPLTFNYSDVGLVRLHARKTGVGAPAVTLAGASNAFVVKPASFSLVATCADGTANSANQTSPSASDAKFCRAGQNFSIIVTALNQQGNPTPSYGKESTPETISATWARQLPIPGSDGALPTGNPVFTGSGGVFGTVTNYAWMWDEVGILKATLAVGDGDYLGAGNTTGTAYAGRFYPHHFKVEVTPQCGGFVYSGRPGASVIPGQPFSVKATAMNGKTPAAPTTNYTAGGGFASAVNLSLSAGGSAGNLYVDSTQGGAGAIPATKFVSNGEGEVLHSTVTGRISYVFDSFPTQETTITLHAEDVDTHPSTGIDGTTRARSGRLRLINAYGSELLPIRVEYRAEYWDGNRWLTNTADTCSGIAAANVAGMAPSGSPTFSSGVGFITFPKLGSAGFRDIAVNLNASGNDTSCNATHPPGTTAANRPWLQGHWSAPSNCGGVAAWAQDPNARLRFGSPKAPYIYMRERY